MCAAGTCLSGCPSAAAGHGQGQRPLTRPLHLAVCRALFKTHPLEQSIENQWSFLSQRFGGPKLFTELKGGEPCPQRSHGGWIAAAAAPDKPSHAL